MHGPSAIRIALFTDTLDETNGVTRFLCDLSAYADHRGLSLTIVTCAATPTRMLPNRANFTPLFSRPMPYYAELSLNLPPILKVLAWAREQRFDAIHISTPGPMGFCGRYVAKRLGLPLLGTYHTDFPNLVQQYVGDDLASGAAENYLRWLYAPVQTLFTRSRGSVELLRRRGICPDRLQPLPPGVDSEKFHPSRCDDAIWRKLGIPHRHRLLYVGRLSAEKNLPFLAETFRDLCRRRADTALILAGSGPCLDALRTLLRDLPAYFMGACGDHVLATLYASSDLFVFPSRGETLGQVVLEAQASGLPAIVTTDGGPKEIVEHEASGLILPTDVPAHWRDAIATLLSDAVQRSCMTVAALEHGRDLTLARTFECFWSAHTVANALGGDAVRQAFAPVNA